ncbi:cinnamoyl-CoA reductase 1-like [Telopea speciosissima]|uniref:cinnamoyl-CoA reductase 1-like n=1 Tax=Telopea speciosissima TaxID=54955 RepID=UPI001CC79875|nr:cinnamoyl-CoA reductase 1-like [Telopea speciosissima]
MAIRKDEVVCVTRGSGFIGSWLVRLLLERGYTVHATVKDLNDDRDSKHLEALEGADSRLCLFQIDLLDYDSLLTALNGTVGLFHLASPCIVDRVLDPQKELLEPAISGMINALKAAKECGVRRVVVTSSISAIIPSPNGPQVEKTRFEDLELIKDLARHETKTMRELLERCNEFANMAEIVQARKKVIEAKPQDNKRSTTNDRKESKRSRTERR